MQVSGAGAAYLVGAVLGALCFGRLTDQWWRKKLFMLTMGLYLVATMLTALCVNFIWLAACRFLAGAGIGGEYTAINSGIDDLIPARVRGRTGLATNSAW